MEVVLTVNHCCCHKTRVIALLYGVKLSVVHYLVLSQSTRVTDGQNYDSQDSASIAASCGKKYIILAADQLTANIIQP